MSTAAAAAAVQKAIERQEIAIQARIRGVELAHEADEARTEPRRNRLPSAAIRRGETRPVPKNAIPASVMKRLAAERREREKKRGHARGLRRPGTHPRARNGKLGSGKKGKQAKAAKAPPRPARHQERSEGGGGCEDVEEVGRADACAVCGEPDPDHWDAKDEIIFCDGCNLQVHLSCYGMRKRGRVDVRRMQRRARRGQGEARAVWGVCALPPAGVLSPG